MKQIVCLVFLFLFAKNSFSGDLCDASCNLTIAFPDGGSITAVEPLTVTFGDGGLVDTVATNTAYVNGNTLVLGAGEVLTFGAGGSFDLGTSGNIAYTNMAIETTGNITIDADAGTGTITIQNISIATSDTVTLASQTNIENSLTLSGDLTIAGASITNNGSLEINSGTITLGTNIDSSSGTISAGSGSLTVLSSGSLTLNNGDVIIDSSLSTIELNSTTPVIDLGGVVTLLNEITIDGVLYTSDDGLVFKDPDGVTGSVEFIDGELVFVPDEIKQDDSSGALDLLAALALPFVVSVFRRRQAKVFSMRKC